MLSQMTLNDANFQTCGMRRTHAPVPDWLRAPDCQCTSCMLPPSKDDQKETTTQIKHVAYSAFACRKQHLPKAAAIRWPNGRCLLSSKERLQAQRATYYNMIYLSYIHGSYVSEHAYAIHVASAALSTNSAIPIRALMSSESSAFLSRYPCACRL
jgi:hypothetical protein